MHYLVLPDSLVPYSLVLLESLRFFAMFLVCYFYAKKSTIFLPSHKRWLLFLRIFLVSNFIWQLGVFIISELNFRFAFENYRLLCKTTLFLMLRISGELASFVFLGIGFVITFNARSINKRSEEQAMHV